jgi:hypothetical protein
VLACADEEVLLKRRGWDISQQRVGKVMDELGLVRRCPKPLPVCPSAASLPLFMGTHWRLGSASPVFLLDAHVLESVLECYARIYASLQGVCACMCVCVCMCSVLSSLSMPINQGCASRRRRIRRYFAVVSQLCPVAAADRSLQQSPCQRTELGQPVPRR